MKDTGPSEIPGLQAGANKDTSEWPEAKTPVTSNTMPGFHFHQACPGKNEIRGND